MNPPSRNNERNATKSIYIYFIGDDVHRFLSTVLKFSRLENGNGIPTEVEVSGNDVQRDIESRLRKEGGKKIEGNVGKGSQVPFSSVREVWL